MTPTPDINGGDVLRPDRARLRDTSTAVVVAGGDLPGPQECVGLPGGATVIAVDHGLDHAVDLGWSVDHAVGDFDSVTPDVLEAARRAGVSVEQHPTDKDATDLELGLARAVELGATRLVVVGMSGGRLDHLLANVSVLGAPGWPAVTIEARLGPARIHVVRGRPGADGPPSEVHLVGRPGQVVTLLALHGPVAGVSTHGLRYPLADATLHPGTTRGVSNEFVDVAASVGVVSGVLLVVVPDGADQPFPPTNPGGSR